MAPCRGLHIDQHFGGFYGGVPGMSETPLWLPSLGTKLVVKSVHSLGFGASDSGLYRLPGLNRGLLAGGASTWAQSLSGSLQKP